MNFLPKSSKTGNFQKRFIENLSHNFKVALLSIEYQKSVLLHFTKILILMNSAFYENFIREKWTSLITPKPLITPTLLGPEVGVLSGFHCNIILSNFWRKLTISFLGRCHDHWAKSSKIRQIVKLKVEWCHLYEKGYLDLSNFFQKKSMAYILRLHHNHWAMSSTFVKFL